MTITQGKGQSVMFSELRRDGTQRRRRVFASGDSSLQPRPIHVCP